MRVDPVCIASFLVCLALLLSSCGRNQSEKSAAPVFAPPPPVATADLKNRADAVLQISDNIQARRRIRDIFTYVDRLIEEGKKNETVPYLEFALTYYGWALKYQLQYAEILMAQGKAEQAKEIAELVNKNAETDDLLNRSAKLLGKESLAPLPPLSTPPGEAYAVVYVALDDCDTWLLQGMQTKLQEVLGVPVHIQKCDMKLPPPGRDRKDRMLHELRTTVQNQLRDPLVTKAMAKLNLQPSDLDDDAVLIRLFTNIIETSQGSDAVVKFGAALAEAEGMDQQWDIDQMDRDFGKVVEPYRRPNVGFIGVTSRDCYRDNNNFLFAIGDKTGGIVSYCRYTSDFNNEPPSPERLMDRTFKQCMDLGGIVLGTKLCQNPACVSAYPHSLAEHDAKMAQFCPACSRIIKESLTSMGQRSEHKAGR